MPEGMCAVVPPEDVTTDELDAEAYRALYDFSPDGVLFTSPDGRVLAANPAACEILGRTEEEICALGRQGLADPSDDRWALLLAERGRAGQAHGIAQMIHGDGSAVEIEMNARLFIDGRGAQRSCTVIRNVTERVRMERELENSRARLAEAERVAQIGSWEWDLVNDNTTWSDGLFHIYGLSREQFDPSFDGGIRRVFPEDRELVRASIETALAQRSSFTLEYRVLRADGRVRTLRSQGDVVVNDAGEPVRLVGVVQDVTDATPALGISGAGERSVGPRIPLTPRQLEIVQLIAEGMTNVAIAKRLVVTEGTVKWHVKQILAKTGSANRAEAVARVLGESHTVQRSRG
jgi:PAS domain S-box-containing protein